MSEDSDHILEVRQILRVGSGWFVCDRQGASLKYCFTRWARRHVRHVPLRVFADGSVRP